MHLLNLLKMVWHEAEILRFEVTNTNNTGANNTRANPRNTAGIEGGIAGALIKSRELEVVFDNSHNYLQGVR